MEALILKVPAGPERNALLYAQRRGDLKNMADLLPGQTEAQRQSEEG
jgi:hypothetical protein